MIKADWLTAIMGLLLLVICGTTVLATPTESMLPGYKKKILVMTAASILLTVVASFLNHHPMAHAHAHDLWADLAGLLESCVALLLLIASLVLSVRAGRLFCETKRLDRRWAWMTFGLGPLGLTAIALAKGFTTKK